MEESRKFTSISINSKKFVLHVPEDMESDHKELLQKLFKAQSGPVPKLLVDIRSVSKSGMSRKVAYWLCLNDRLFLLNQLISQILGRKLQKGLVVARGYDDEIGVILYNFWSRVLRTKDGKPPKLEDIRGLIAYEQLPILGVYTK